MTDLPPLRDIAGDLHVVSLPLVTRFRGIDVREAVLVRGPTGWAEFSPFVEYEDDEAATWLAATIEAGWSEPAPQVRGTVPVNATIPAVTADRVPGLLARFPGCRTAKVKVAERGGALADDVARVAAVRDALGPAGRIRIDANGGWNVDEAERAIRALEHYDLEYVEQPCASIEELVEIRRRVTRAGILIAADESIRKASDPYAVARAGAADVLVIKVQPLGGIRPALQIVSDTGLPAVVSSALDTSVGLAHGAALAGALPALEFDCGLGTAALLGADVCNPPLLPRDGAIPVAPPVVDETALRRHAAVAERAAWWRDRVARCYAVLSGR